MKIRMTKNVFIAMAILLLTMICATTIFIVPDWIGLIIFIFFIGIMIIFDKLL